uniref:Uncharacterized protein n=1 Tax=Arundo donax TaxID=35708 RepID=A0A0A9EAT6_ARUDO
MIVKLVSLHRAAYGYHNILRNLRIPQYTTKLTPKEDHRQASSQHPYLRM